MLDRRSLLKAASAIPLAGAVSGWKRGVPLTLTQLQTRYLQYGFGMFVHFSMSTFLNVENAGPAQALSTFAPSALSIDQWISTAKSAKMRYMVLVAKHSDGFCLWNTATTAYNVMGSPVATDLCAQFATKCRAAGIMPCFYLSKPDGTLNNLSLSTPAQVSYYNQQISELLGNYGFTGCLWIDWAGLTPPAPFASQSDIINTANTFQAAQCLTVQNDHTHTLTTSNIVAYEFPVGGAPAGGNVDAAECCNPIRSDVKWFWNSTAVTYPSASSIASMVTSLNGNRCNYLLDCPPDTTGTIPAACVTVLQNVGPLLP